MLHISCIQNDMQLQKKIFKFHSAFLFSKLTNLENFRKFFNTTENENTDILEHHHQDTKVPCLPLSLIIVAFHIHFLSIQKDMQHQKNSKFTQPFYLPSAPIWIKELCNDCITFQKKNKPVPYQEQIAEKQNFKGQLKYFNHRISFVTKLLVSPFSEGNSYIIF